MNKLLNKQVQTGFGVGIVTWIDSKNETALVRLDGGSCVSVLVSELKPIKRYKLLGA